MRGNGQVGMVVGASLTVGLLCGLAILAGWSFGLPWLRSFGSEPYAAQPLTGVAVIALALALHQGIGGRTRTARATLAIPVLIAMAALFQDATGIAAGTDELLFGDAVARQPFPNPGRTGASSAVTLLVLALSIGLAADREGRRRRLVAFLGSLALFVSALSIVLVPVETPFRDSILRAVEPFAVPSALAAGAVAFALLVWRGDFGFSGRMNVAGVEGPVARTVLLLTVMTPIATEFLQDALEASRIVSPAAADLIETALLIIAMLGLLFWAAGRISVEHRVRQALIRALDSAPIALTDTKGVILHWSKGCERLYGWTAAEARGRSKYELLGSAPTANGPPPSELMDSARSWSAEMIERAHDGATLHILEQARFLEPRHGGEPVFVLSMTDISARTRAEAALIEREAQLRSLLEAVPDATVTGDEKGIIRYFSPAAEKLFGYAAEEVIGRHFRLLIPPHARDDDAELPHGVRLDMPIVPGKPFSLWAVHRDGREIPVEVVVGEAEADGRKLYTGFIRDVSERLAAEARFAGLQADLMHVSRLSAMGEMAAGLAHELNQPLTAAVNNLTTAAVLLGREQEAAKAKELIERARDQTLGTGAIIRRLRAFVERGEVQMVSERLGDVVSEAVALSRSAIGQNEVDVSVTLDSGCEAVMADRVQVQQVLVNLLRNAIEAMAETPRTQRRITINSQCLPEEGRVAVTVSDTGPGLSPEALQQLYKPFASTKQHGMGVGLSICRRIIEAHGGSLSAGNHSDGGAFFQFTLQTPVEQTPGS